MTIVFMRPNNLKTKIFLDSGDPRETEETLKLLGFLDGQTTNPTLIAKNPKIAQSLQAGKIAEEKVWEAYQQVAQGISQLIPEGSISEEVYADADTTSEQMLEIGRKMFTWIPNAHIKYPTNTEGLKAAEQSIKEGIRVNMTLCFTQQQAAAVYAATLGAQKGQVFVSPFIGRLDDLGQNGMDLIKNIIEMYKGGDGHVEVLTASVRNLNHLLEAIKLGSDIITAPFKVLTEWAEKGLPVPLTPIPYQEIDLTNPWTEYNIYHELTDKGIQKFADDWNNLIK